MDRCVFAVPTVSLMLLPGSLLSQCQTTVFVRVAKSKYIKMDLTKAYFHVSLEVAGWKVTVFGTPLVLFQYKVLPFGLVNSPAVFS